MTEKVKHLAAKRSEYNKDFKKWLKALQKVGIWPLIKIILSNSGRILYWLTGKFITPMFLLRSIKIGLFLYPTEDLELLRRSSCWVFSHVTSTRLSRPVSFTNFLLLTRHPSLAVPPTLFEQRQKRNILLLLCPGVWFSIESSDCVSAGARWCRWWLWQAADRPALMS